MFGHAYCIAHVKSSETNSHGITVHVDMAKTFGLMNQHDYKGYCSMEWDDAGDTYAGNGWADSDDLAISFISKSLGFVSLSVLSTIPGPLSVQLFPDD